MIDSLSSASHCDTASRFLCRASAISAAYARYAAVSTDTFASRGARHYATFAAGHADIARITIQPLAARLPAAVSCHAHSQSAYASQQEDAAAWLQTRFRQRHAVFFCR